MLLRDRSNIGLVREEGLHVLVGLGVDVIVVGRDLVIPDRFDQVWLAWVGLLQRDSSGIVLARVEGRHVLIGLGVNDIVVGRDLVIPDRFYQVWLTWVSLQPL